jgi:glycerol-3-phosphate O-acyltransferase / dihydroxyacetone phosphate acyltransferase
MFKNPVTGFIMSSSGAIPVSRNPNRTENNASDSNGQGKDTGNTTNGTSGSNHSGSSTSQANLFHATSIALQQGRVIGVFPEATSYTQPSILQIMSGAAWAAVEYSKWKRKVLLEDGSGGKTKEKQQLMDVVIIPVGIVYTDKSRYLSRVGTFSFLVGLVWVLTKRSRSVLGA